MEEEEKIIFRKKAKLAILNIALYIELKGYPETAEKFAVQLVKFGLTLSLFPNKYPVCRHLALAKRNFHCAVFRKNYIFVYKVVKKQVVIYNIIHAHTNPVLFRA